MEEDPRPRIGKYRQQYVYRCPSPACRHAIVEPYVLPAAAAIDWSDLGQRIGDRKRPLAAATMRRIRAGLELFAGATVVAAGGNTWERPGSDYVRAWPAGTAPLNARTGTPGDAVATPPPFMVYGDCRRSGRRRLRSVDEPMGTVIASGRTVRTLVVPPGALVPAGGTWNDDPAPLDNPMRTRTARAAEGLLTPPVVVNVNHHGDDGRPVPRPTPPRSRRAPPRSATAWPWPSRSSPCSGPTAPPPVPTSRWPRSPPAATTTA